jgi:two-component system sensor histidine kinase and response regulator WspE
MLELFQAEMDTHVPVLNQGLLALEKGQAGDREIEAMMRAAHSIKGAARIVGIEPAVRVAHSMEDCFTAAKNKTIVLSSDVVDVLLEGVDALQRICSPQESSAMTEASLGALLGQIGLIKSGGNAMMSTTGGGGSVAATTSTDLVAATIRREEPSITLPEVFDDSCTAAVRRELLDTLSLRPGRILLDFAHVDQLTTGALALLIAFSREANRSEPAPVIEARGVSSGVQSILRVAGLAHVFGLDG